MRMAFLTILLFILFASPAAISRPLNEDPFDRAPGANLHLNASKNSLSFACPAGSYLSMGERHEREARLTAAWEARLRERIKIGLGQSSLESGLVRLASSLKILKLYCYGLSAIQKCTSKTRRLLLPLCLFLLGRTAVATLSFFMFRYTERTRCELRGCTRIVGPKRPLLCSRPAPTLEPTSSSLWRMAGAL